jgi:hypothetical protein
MCFIDEYDNGHRVLFICGHNCQNNDDDEESSEFSPVEYPCTISSNNWTIKRTVFGGITILLLFLVTFNILLRFVFKLNNSIYSPSIIHDTQ